MILKKGKVLFSQDEESDLYILKKGLLKATRLQPNGSCFLFNLLVPGEIFPHHSLLTSTRTFGNVSAVLESEVQIIPQNEWYADLKKDSNKYREIALHLQFTVQRVQQRTQLLLAPPKERISLFRQWLKVVESDTKIESLLTQEEIGQFLGLARETVNRLLRLK